LKWHLAMNSINEIDSIARSCGSVCRETEDAPLCDQILIGKGSWSRTREIFRPFQCSHMILMTCCRCSERRCRREECESCRFANWMQRQVLQSPCGRHLRPESYPAHFNF
jgi:hypothetical protein